ncbi:amidohydrolase family protein [Roseiarcaceae bacterium H3SJ34-1]|uniref:amidohydrolase family protein n=1 Tax=Terripilifer ovatus TaxID=3032367 RepID=UPI003AB9A48C|nr:amidohydrolase family protein [Roseiarcaceae bacterium H3SJ34-1]
MSILIRSAHKVIGLPHGAVGHDLDILIEGDRIAAIGKDLAVEPARQSSMVVLDGRQRLVFPGLVNAHAHSNESFEQGLSQRLPLELWRLRTYAAAPALTEQDYYLRALFFGVASLRAGVTTIQDDVINLGFTPASVDGACRAYRDLGLRAWVTTSVGDRGLAESHAFLQLDDGASRAISAEAQMALFFRNRERWHGAENGRIQINLGPRGPQRCSPALLAQIGEAAERTGCAVHMHVLETRGQAVMAQQEYGRSAIAHLQDIGLTTPRLTINHGIWLTDADIDMLASNGCRVTHNPSSNLKLGSGLCRLRDLLSAGIKVGLGTDGLATSDTADMQLIVRLTALLHSIQSPDYERWISAQEALQMATVGGAATGLHDGNQGVIGTGFKADIILLDRHHPGFIPLNDPVAQLAFSASSDAVQSAIVDGRLVMHERRLTMLDETEALGVIAEAAERWRRDVAPATLAGAADLTPAMAASYHRSIEAFETETWARPLRSRRY